MTMMSDGEWALLGEPDYDAYAQFLEDSKNEDVYDIDEVWE